MHTLFKSIFSLSLAIFHHKALYNTFYQFYSHYNILKASTLSRIILLDHTTGEHLTTLEALNVIPTNLMLSQSGAHLVLS